MTKNTDMTKNYRYLIPGDFIQDGDEVNVAGFDSNEEVWHRTTKSTWGMPILTNGKTFRRPTW